MDVDIALASSDASEISVPGATTLPAGQTQAPFLLNVPEDQWLDGNAVVSLSATVTGWAPGMAEITVTDLTNITLQLPETLLEGESATGSVYVTGASLSNITIAVVADDPHRIAVTSPVVIAPGALTTSVEIHGVEDGTYRGDQAVNVSAQAVAFSPTARSIDFLENDPHHFTISPIPVTQRAWVYFNVTITAHDHRGGVLTNYTQRATVSAAGVGGSLELSPVTTFSFNQGSRLQPIVFDTWDHLVRVTVDDGNGNTGESNPFNVSPPAAYHMDIGANDLAWDGVRERLYASVRGHTYRNTIAVIDPRVGRVESTIPMGVEPGRLVITEDCSHLYIGMVGTNTIRRLDLASRTVDQEFSVGTYPSGIGWDYLLYVEDMELQPGTSNVLAVSRMRPTVSPRHTGVVVFDDGVVRANVYEPRPGPNFLEFGGTPERLYGYETQVSSFGFLRMRLTPQGVVGDGSSVLMREYGADFRYANGRIYATTGYVYDPESGNLVGSFSGPVLPIPAPSIGRVLCVTDRGALEVFDETTLALRHRQYFPGGLNGSGDPRGGIRWGDAGIAFHTSYGRVVIVRSDFLADQDRDGLDDAWEREHFGVLDSPHGSPDADPDGDGLSNAAEQMAGTDPLLGASVVQISHVGMEHTDLLIEFPTILGRAYRLERMPELGMEPEAQVGRDLPGTGGPVSILDTNAVSGSTWYYRLSVF